MVEPYFIAHQDILAASRELNKVMDLKSPMGPHLKELFLTALFSQLEPLHVVELGVERGQSTWALWLATKLRGGWMTSVDHSPLMEGQWPKGERWSFYQADSVQFAKRYPSIMKERGIPCPVSLLFVDTSHQYEMTRREIRKWVKFIPIHGMMVFHDTNQRNGNTGVSDALSDFLGYGMGSRCKADGSDYLNGWYVLIYPHSDGLTILQRENLMEVPESWRKYCEEYKDDVDVLLDND